MSAEAEERKMLTKAELEALVEAADKAPQGEYKAESVDELEVRTLGWPRALQVGNSHYFCALMTEDMAEYMTAIDPETLRRLVFELQSWKEKYVELVMVFVASTCETHGEFDLDSCCVSSRADAMRELAELGKIKIGYDDGKRRVRGDWIR